VRWHVLRWLGWYVSAPFEGFWRLCELDMVRPNDAHACSYDRLRPSRAV